MTTTPEYPIKPRCDVTENDEFRTGPGGEWLTDEFAAENTNTYWVEVRPKQQPDPKWITDDQDGWWPDDIIVTTVGEMRDRTDLDQWERAGAPGWFVFDRWTFENAAGDHPIIVRRKS